MKEFNDSPPAPLTMDADTLTAGLLAEVTSLVAELHPRQSRAKPATLDSSLDRDLGLDSLARVELLARIEKRFCLSLPERVFADAETVRDLMRAIRGAGSTKSTCAPVEIVPIEPGDEVPAPHHAQTLIDVLDWHARNHPDRAHIRLYSDDHEGEVLTYQHLSDGATLVAAGLQHQGLQLGEPVVIMLPTGFDYFRAFFGVLLAGGIPVPIYPPARMSQIEDHLRRHQAIVANCGALTLITVPEAKPLARLLKSLVASLQHLVTVTDLSAEARPYYKPTLAGHGTALLQYTSGSTGNPKGVILTHANLLANMRAMGDAVQVQSNDVFVSWLPLYHDMGLIGAWLTSLYYAMPLILMSPVDFIGRPQRWLWAIHRFRGTLSASPNFGYELCLKRLQDEDLSKLDLSCWRGALNGAEPVSPSTVERFCRHFASYGFRREAYMPVYGLAECSVGLAFPGLDRGPLLDVIEREPFVMSGRAVPAGSADPAALRFMACGRPLPGHEVRILDAAGRELPDRQEGRLQFRGPSTCGGYFRNPEETARLFDGDWLNSGDLAYIAEGEIYLTGRTKDLIIRAGRNIYPQELEELVGDIPGIRKGGVVVFASNDPRSGTERLVIVAETSVTAPELLEEVRTVINAVTMDLLGTPADDIVLTAPKTVLKTSSGKIRRAANRELYERGWHGKPRSAVWWQVMRIALEGVKPRIRRTLHRLVAGLYAGYVWLLFGAIVPLLWVSIVVLPRPSWSWAVGRGAARFLRWACGIALNVHGLENLPADRSFVLVANHASYIDSFVLAAALPRPLGFVAKGELVNHWSTRLPLSRLQAQFVERFDKEKSLEDARRIGHSAGGDRPLVFFAEGTFTRVPGLLPFHLGAFVTAVDHGVPVVPIAIRGTRFILRSGSWFPRRGDITITIGEPIEPPEAKTGAPSDKWAAALRLRDLTREHILRHSGEPDLEHEKWPVLRRPHQG